MNAILTESFDSSISVDALLLASNEHYHIGHDPDGRPVEWDDREIDPEAIRPETGYQFAADDGVIWYASTNGWTTNLDCIATYGERT